jgi:hypothetical protein
MPTDPVNYRIIFGYPSIKIITLTLRGANPSMAASIYGGVPE